MNADEMNLELCQDLLDTISQQQAEIAELKNARDYWCLQYKDVFNKLDTRSYLMGRYDTSLVKDLTDEEIRAIHEQTDGNLNMIEFARAILRKAQEK